jgi:6-phosphogluconolactonase
LSELEVQDTLPARVPENLVADIHVSADGERVYVSNRGHNSIAVFGVEADGRLTRLGVPYCGGDWPRNFALAPGGRFALVANQYSGEVVVLPLRTGPEEIGAPVTRAAIRGASCVQFVEGNG